jgi:thiamine monophosphate synthase
VSVDGTGAMMAAGAHGVAVMRGVWDAPDPPAASARYLAELGGSTDENGSRG